MSNQVMCHCVGTCRNRKLSCTLTDVDSIRYDAITYSDEPECYSAAGAFECLPDAETFEHIRYIREDDGVMLDDDPRVIHCD